MSDLHRFLHQIGFSRQKLRIDAVQHDDFLRAQFVSDVSISELEMLIILDETGIIIIVTQLESMAIVSEESHLCPMSY